MDKPLSLETIVNGLKFMLDEISRSISEMKKDLSALECKDELSQKEKLKCDDLQYKMEFLEAQQDSVDKALCLLIDYI